MRLKSVLAGMLLAIAVSCHRSNPGDFYEGVPFSAEYPKPEAVLRQWVACGDIHAMRRHAWFLFGEMTRPSKWDPRIARWETWYDKRETFPLPNAPISPHRPRGWLAGALEPDPELRHLWARGISIPDSVVLYNREAHGFILATKLYLTDTFKKLAQAGEDEVPGFGAPSIALKASWKAVGKKLDVGVWDGENTSPGDIVNEADLAPRKVCVSDAPANCAGSDWPFQPVSKFYSIDISALPVRERHGLLTQVERDKLLPAKEIPRYLILVGLHFATREQTNWAWATFWWHDYPDAGRYAEDRPRTGIASPWNNYVMEVSYDMDLPREPDTTPHIAFNPYIEGFLPDGVRSNCMSCHRRSMWQPGRGKEDNLSVLLSDGTIGTASIGQTVVRGYAAATGTYLDTPFENQFKLSFLWSLKACAYSLDDPQSCFKSSADAQDQARK